MFGLLLTLLSFEGVASADKSTAPQPGTVLSRQAQTAVKRAARLIQRAEAKMAALDRLSYLGRHDEAYGQAPEVNRQVEVLFERAEKIMQPHLQSIWKSDFSVDANAATRTKASAVFRGMSTVRGELRSYVAEAEARAERKKFATPPKASRPTSRLSQLPGAAKSGGHKKSSGGDKARGANRPSHPRSKTPRSKAR